MYSITYTGIIITVLGYFFQAAGVPFVPEQAETTVSFITALIGAVTALIGRHRAGGINWLGKKTN